MRFTNGTMKGTKGHVGPATSQQTQVKSAQREQVRPPLK